MKHLLEKVASALRSDTRPRTSASSGDGFKVFVRIEQPLMAERRIRKYEKPLHAELMLAHLGHVTGGGSVQGTDGTIHWISVELKLRNLDGALHFACAKLRELGAPAGSTVKYTEAGRPVTRQLE